MVLRLVVVRPVHLELVLLAGRIVQLAQPISQGLAEGLVIMVVWLQVQVWLHQARLPLVRLAVWLMM
jgi:hypothetical protein